MTGLAEGASMGSTGPPPSDLSGDLGGSSECPTLVHTGSFEAASDTELEGLRGVTEVTANLTITNVLSLGALQCLRSVAGELRISATQRTDLTGLEALSRAGNLTIDNNAALASLEGLGISQVESVISVFGNYDLEEVRFEHLSSAPTVTIGLCVGRGGLGYGNAVTRIEFPSVELGSGIDSLSINDNPLLSSLDEVLAASASIGGLGLRINEVLDGPAVAQAWIAAGNDAADVSTCGNLNDAVPCKCPGLP